jgi:hypothetical protein
MPARAARPTNSTPYCIAAWLPRGRTNELHVQLQCMSPVMAMVAVRQCQRISEGGES